MSHPTSDHLTAWALGDGTPTADEQGHLDSCGTCRQEYVSLSTVTSLARQTRELADLPAPPDRVWAMIAAATGATPTPESQLAADPNSETAPRSTRITARERPTRRVSGWLRLAAVGAAALIVGVVGAIGAMQLADRLDQPSLTAEASLTAYGDTPAAAHGTAELLTGGDGHRTLVVRVAGLPTGPGYYEVWLIDPTTLQMISVGVLGNQPEVTLPLPDVVDAAAFSLVDVSAEPLDGNVEHSGDSLLRGTLT